MLAWGLEWQARMEETMMYRMRTYTIIPARLEAFNALFHRELEPIFVRFGTRTVGRWQNLERSQVVAVFEYDNLEHYRQSDAAVRSDPEYLMVMARASADGAFYTAFEDVLMTPTNTRDSSDQ
jgi:8-oxo-dGTP diphosphatase